MLEQLRKIIEEIRNNSRMASFDERKTQQEIILRILQCLNWDIFNTDEVYREYYIPEYRDHVDYCLRIDDNNKVFIETKRVSDKLKDKTQLCDYANHQDVKLAIFTNGVSWEFFLPRTEGTWEQRKFYTIDIYQQNLEDIASKFSDFLERGKVANGNAIKNAEITHEGQKGEKMILRTLPKAWDKIIKEPDESLVKLMKDITEKLCGYEPDDEHVKQFLRKIATTLICLPMPIHPLAEKKSSKRGSMKLKHILRVIECMKKGVNYADACREVAKATNVEESTVRDKCTRGLYIITEEFVKLVEEGNIDNLLKQKFPDYTV